MQNNQGKKVGSFTTLLLKLTGLMAIYVAVRNSNFLPRTQTALDNLVQSLTPSHSLTPQIENQEVCIATPSRLDRGSEIPQHLFLTPSDKILLHKAELEKTLSLKDSEFGGNALHINLINHNYYDALTIINSYPNYRDQLLNQQDKNGRTPLHLALEAGAPPEIISQILTPENVAIVDKDGVTPIMLAMRGAVDVELMRKMIRMIPQDKQTSVLQQKDNQGLAERDWNQMPREELLKRFANFEVDGTRDEKYCTSSLFFNDKNSYLATPTFSDKAAEVIGEAGLEVGSNYWVGEEYKAIKATKENVRKLKTIATEETLEAQEARKELSSFWWQNSSKEAPLWEYIGTEMDKIYDELSGISLVDRFLENQKNLAKLIKPQGVKATQVDKVQKTQAQTQAEL